MMLAMQTSEIKKKAHGHRQTNGCYVE